MDSGSSAEEAAAATRGSSIEWPLVKDKTIFSRNFTKIIAPGTLRKPRDISASLRFCRWFALFTGIIVAQYRYYKYCKLENRLTPMINSVNNQREIRDKIIELGFQKIQDEENERQSKILKDQIEKSM